MKIAVKLLSLISMAIILSHCTIEKRHYQKGYHVEWNSRHKSKQLQEKSEELASAEIGHVEGDDHILPDSTQQTGLSPNLEERTTTNSEISEKHTPSQKPFLSRKTTAFIEKRKEIFRSHIDFELPPKTTPNEADEMAQKSFNYGILTWMITGFSILLNVLEVASIVTLLMPLGALICAIMAVVYGKWAKEMMIESPGKYANKQKAITGMVLGWVYLILAIISVLLLVFLLFLLLAAFG